jgi:hypothetical protein
VSYPWSANDILTAADLNAALAAAGPPGVHSWSGKAGGSDQTGISTIADITGATVTWTADSTRIYKMTLNVNVQKITTANSITTYLTNGSNGTVLARSTTLAINDLADIILVWTESGLSGSTTRKGRIETASGTVTVVNSFSRNAILVVEDIGPA